MSGNRSDAPATNRLPRLTPPPEPQSLRRSPGRAFWDSSKQVILAIVVALVLKVSVVEAYRIPSESMADTLLVGDYLLANKYIYGSRIPLTNLRLPALREPVVGDIVIFQNPNAGLGDTKIIKRIVAVPGDTVQVIDKRLYVNGELRIDSAFAKNIDTLADGTQHIYTFDLDDSGRRDNYGPFVVPEAKYFVLGDNRDRSSDSRIWGAVPRHLILGKAFMIHWSWDDNALPAPEVSLEDPLSVPRSFAHSLVHFVDKVRWERIFTSLK